VTAEDTRSWARLPSPGEITAAIAVDLRLRSTAQLRRRKGREGDAAALVGEQSQRGLDRR
jgi:hypothetical protein